MKETIHADRFVNAFDEIGRSNNFSEAARYALFEHFEELEENTGEELEFDPIAICCDYSEYKDLLDFAETHFADAEQRNHECGITDPNDEDEVEVAIIEYILNRSEFIEAPDCIIVSQF